MADGGDDLLQPPALAEQQDDFEIALRSAATPSLHQHEKISKYSDIASFVFSASPPDVSQAKRFVQHVMSDVVALPVARQVMDMLMQKISQIGDTDIQIDLALYALTQMQPCAASFGGQVFDLRESLAELYESEGNLSKAADILIGIDFDSKIRILGDYTKFVNYVHIANLCLQDKDVLKAEPYIEKASRLVQEISEPDLILNYKLCKAEYLDMNLKLLEAAKHYHEISETRQHEIGTIEIIEEEMQDVLNSAVTCALLCGACPERSRVLNMLSQDKRCSKLKIYPVLQKVILGEFLYKDDIASLEENLMPHHKTPLPDSSTLLDQMMVEHNLLCTNSEKYPSFDLFNSMLGIDPRKVTKSAAVMSASKMRSALCSVKDEVTKTQHILRLERDAYGAYEVLQTERRLHLDTAQAHERADRGYSELTETVQNIIKKIVSDLDAAADSLGSELESIDLTLSEP